MRPLFAPRRMSEARMVEATQQQIAASGAYGSYATDPIDGDRGYTLAGSRGLREVPYWTREKALVSSVAGYRTNPMVRAIVDTYIAFVVGDSGLTLTCPDPATLEVANKYWHDPRNRLDSHQEAMLRDLLLTGELANEMMVGQVTGVTRINPIDTTRVLGVVNLHGNPLWPDELRISSGDLTGQVISKQVVAPDDLSGLLTGEVVWHTPWKALLTDTRGDPFLMPVIDWLDSYDRVLSNLVDRTALARYLAFDVEIDGTPEDVKEFIKSRGGAHVPRSGGIEAHNKAVKWTPLNGLSGSFEDTNTNSAIQTNIAAGVGLSKPWLAEPDGANRATSISMAEPVRRRVGSVQNMYIAIQLEQVRYAVDQAVAAHRIPAMVSIDGGEPVPASSLINITGPEVAAADAQVNAEILVSLASALTGMKNVGLISAEAAEKAAQRGWEGFMGIPYSKDLDQADGSKVDLVAELLDDPDAKKSVALKLA